MGGKGVNLGQWLGYLSFLISLYVIWEIQHLLLLFFTAIVFATVLNRLVRGIQQWGLSRNQAVVTTLVLTLVVVMLFIGLIVPPFVEQFQKLLELLPQVWERIRSQLLSLQSQSQQWEWLPPLPPLADLVQQLPPVGTELLKNFVAFFSNSLLALLELLLVIILTVMLLINPRLYRQGLLKLFPSFYRRRAEEILTLSEKSLSSWIEGIVISSIFVGVCSGIGLSILGINLILVHALLAGLLNFIPNIGPTASVIFPVAIALLEDPWKIGAIVILYVVIQNLESYLVTPTIMAQQVSLLPAVTLIAQVFFAQTFGLLGLLLALPLTVIAKTWIEEVLLKDILDHWRLSSSPTNLPEAMLTAQPQEIPLNDSSHETPPPPSSP